MNCLGSQCEGFVQFLSAAVPGPNPVVFVFHAKDTPRLRGTREVVMQRS